MKKKKHFRKLGLNTFFYPWQDSSKEALEMSPWCEYCLGIVLLQCIETGNRNCIAIFGRPKEQNIVGWWAARPASFSRLPPGSLMTVHVSPVSLKLMKVNPKTSQIYLKLLLLDLSSRSWRKVTHRRKGVCGCVLCLVLSCLQLRKATGCSVAES